MNEKITAIMKVNENQIRVMRIDNEYNFEKYSKENFYEFYLNQYIDIIIAVEDGIDVGYAIIMSIFDECNLIKIVVNKDYRNKNYGSQILGYIKDFVKQKNIKKIFLEVRCDNYIAKTFYEKNKFIKGDVRKGYYDGIDCDIYWYYL